MHLFQTHWAVMLIWEMYIGYDSSSFTHSPTRFSASVPASPNSVSFSWKRPLLDHDTALLKSCWDKRFELPLCALGEIFIHYYSCNWGQVCSWKGHMRNYTWLTHSIRVTQISSFSAELHFGRFTEACLTYVTEWIINQLDWSIYQSRSVRLQGYYEILF